MNSSPLLPAHRARGARLAARPEAPRSDTVLTFGDVPAEYRAGLEETLLLDACDAGRLRVSGREAGPFLQRILANDVRSLEPGRGAANLLLSPKGKVQHLFELLAREDGYLLLTGPDDAASRLRDSLDTYLFGEDVTIGVETADSARLELVGPGSGEVLSRALDAPPPELEGSHVELSVAGEPVYLVAARRYGSPAHLVEAGPAGVAELWDRLAEAGARPGGLVARDSLRVEAAAGLPGLDVTEDVYPQEARLEHAFSLAKGCYVGQEVVAKIDTYGGLNKLLCVLALEGDGPLPAGTRLLGTGEDEGRDLGLVTTWAYSFALDGSAALGYVKRRHQEPGTVLLADGRRATVLAPPLREGVLGSAP